MQTARESRRSFIRGRFTHLRDDAIRPPGAVADFADRCTGCADCVAACPEDIIVLDHDRRALVDLTRGGCTFCGDCAAACGDGALDPAGAGAWDWRAQVGTACLSAQGITCRSCEDACDAQAIRFRLATGGRSFAVIDTERCTGCGACAHACPAQAVGFARPAPHQPEVSR